MSITAGFESVIEEAGHAGLRALQVFSRNPVGGQSQDLPVAGSLKPLLNTWGIEVLYVHAPYFVNPATVEAMKQERARVALKQEMRRAKRLSAHYVVVHPGHAASTADHSQSEVAFCDTVTFMLTAPGRVLIENTAGQGRELGSEFSELGRIFDRLGPSRRIGLMLDTAHALAAGHALKTADDVKRLWLLVDRYIGIHRLGGIHLNDSAYPVGAHVDRHEHLLQGSLGLEALRSVVQWALAAHCPLILETPGKNVQERRQDIKTIFDLI